MFKVLTKSGVQQTASEQTARIIAVNAARSRETAVLVTPAGEFIVQMESRGAVIAYRVSDARDKNSELMEDYREVCFQAYAAEEEKAKKAAADAARKARSSKDNAAYEDLGPTWMADTFNHFFGDLIGLTKKK